MSRVIEDYLSEKYGDGGPGSSRFDGPADEVHASQLSDCRRKRAWKHQRSYSSGASPYFELGRIFETIYGAALAHHHDPEITSRELNKLQPWEVAPASDWVQQDVNVVIELDGCTIVGEADWVVYDKTVRSATDEHVDKVVLTSDGRRVAHGVGGSEWDYAGGIAKVVETKTKGDIDWVMAEGADRKHQYQVYPYMRAFDSAGEIAYMERDDWSEHVLPVEMPEEQWIDCEIRAKKLARAQAGAEDPPATTPLDEDECHWCPFEDECKKVGGSVWEG